MRPEIHHVLLHQLASTIDDFCRTDLVFYGRYKVPRRLHVFFHSWLATREARLVSRLLGLKSQEDWYNFVEADAVRALLMEATWDIGRDTLPDRAFSHSRF